MKGEMQEKMGDVFGKLMGIMGVDPKEFLSEEEVNRLLM